MQSLAAEMLIENIDPMADAAGPPRNHLLPLRPLSVTNKFCNCSRMFTVVCLACLTVSWDGTPLGLPSDRHGGR